MKRRKPKVVHVLKFVLMGIAFVTLLGFGIRELWNCLIPDLFHGPVITFWQGLGLCLLGKLLFGWHGGPPGGFRRKRFWDERLKERYANMSPEEREKMKENLKRCFGGRRPGHWGRWNDWQEEEEQPKQHDDLSGTKNDTGTNI